MASNVYQRTITFEDPAATPTFQVISDFVVALDFGGADGATLPALPIGATDIKIATITLVQEDVTVTAPALADLNL